MSDRMTSQNECSALDSIVCDEVEDILDVIACDLMSQRQEDCPLLLLQQNLLLVLSEEVIILTEAHRQEVKKISDVDIVSEGAEVSGNLRVEVQHVLEIARPFTNTFNVVVECLYLLSKSFN